MTDRRFDPSSIKPAAPPPWSTTSAARPLRPASGSDHLDTSRW